jgi:copper chaperone CopZ
MRKILSSVLLVCFISIANILYAAETMVGQVNGMMCIKCQKMVTMKLIEVSPTAHVKVSWPEGVAISAFEGESNLTEQEFKDAILGTGFEVIKVAKADKFIDDAGEGRKLVD